MPDIELLPLILLMPDPCIWTPSITSPLLGCILRSCWDEYIISDGPTLRTNTWPPLLTVWLPGPGVAHVTDFAGIAMRESLLPDVLDDPDIAPAAAGALVDVFDDPQPAAAIADVIVSTVRPRHMLRAPNCMSFLPDAGLRNGPR